MRPISALQVAILGLFLILPGLSLAGRPMVEREITCPLDGTKFRAWTGGSNFLMGKDLDLKPQGAIFAPLSALHPKCPSKGFVIYRPKFSVTEVRKFREYVESDEYKTLVANETDLFLAAKLSEHIGDDPHDISRTFLTATWEVKSQDQYVRYASAALRAFNVALSASYEDRRIWIEDQLVAGELERRLGRFAEAQQRFVSLLDLAEMSEPKNVRFREALEYQLQLIRAEDKQSHRWPSK